MGFHTIEKSTICGKKKKKLKEICPFIFFCARAFKEKCLKMYGKKENFH